MTHVPASPPRSTLLRALVGFAFSAIAVPAPAAQPEPHPSPAQAGGAAYAPKVMPASPEAARAISTFRNPAKLKIELFAAEPLMANPVAFGFDEKGKVYVVETFRLGHGVTDNRDHMNWLETDLASRTVADRVAMYRRYLGKKADEYGVEHDRLRLVEDRDGDGKADHATVFADGFHSPATGLAAGVLARKGDVYFTCIPDLWLLKDKDGDGKADVKTSLQTGYGIHVAFLGHDLHGLIFGPDGRLYFSIGDRGLNVSAGGRTLAVQDTGSVLRCEPDGSALEVFASGLRNPQELAFDDSGNLFTVDNNSDSGDKARLVYIMEGGDSGWRTGYQYLERPVSRGPWNAEKLWHPHFPGQASYIVPPLANLSDGPSGLTYHPGVTLLPDRYRRHFFLADFRGASGTSGLRAFTVTPKGAGFALGDSEQFLWNVLATDVDFGPDGALYLSDWVEGWNLTGKGRLYKVSDPSATPETRAAAREVQRLLAEGFEARPAGELARLLGHADRRVRQEAQFALASRGPEGLKALLQVLDNKGSSSGDRLSRRHAVWALGRIGRVSPNDAPAALGPLVALLNGEDADLAAQSAKALGDARYAPALEGLIRCLAGRSPHARSLAATALGKLGRNEAVGPLVRVLRENADADPFLRHAAATGLAGSGEPKALADAATDAPKSVRLGLLLALRRLGSVEAARFLNDPDPTVVTEAALAVYDTPIEAGLPALAALADRRDLSEPALRRVVQANARVGGPGSAGALARLAARTDVPESVRVEAVEALADASKPPALDRVTGLWRPTPARPAAEAAGALSTVLSNLLRGKSDPVRRAALRAAGPLPLTGSGPPIFALLADVARPAETRYEALRALDRSADGRLNEAIDLAVKDADPEVRVEGQRLLARLRPAEAVPVLTEVLQRGDVREKQGAFATLGGMPPGPADDLLAAWLDRLDAGKVPPEAALDLLEAARLRSSPAVSSRLRVRDAALSKDDPLASYRESLVGGNAVRGGKVFAEKAEVSCVRCHKVKDKGGEVGPDLTGIGKRQDRRYLLESIVAPGRQIAKGFETLVVATVDGQVRSGVLKEETAETLRLISADGQPIVIPKEEVEEKKSGPSAMPDDLIKYLSKSELRDLVEYLSSLK